MEKKRRITTGHFTILWSELGTDFRHICGWHNAFLEVISVSWWSFRSKYHESQIHPLPAGPSCCRNQPWANKRYIHLGHGIFLNTRNATEKFSPWRRRYALHVSFRVRVLVLLQPSNK